MSFDELFAASCSPLIDLHFGVGRLSLEAEELAEELEEVLEEEELEEDVSDLTLGVSTPMLEHVLASKAKGLLLASS